MDNGASCSGERWTLHHGDALDVLRGMPAASCDALVTDPPAGIGFMGRAWDGDLGGRAQWIAAHAAIFAECRRVLVPGAHAIVWALPRTSHWTATSLEDAGFEVRDVAVHLQAQGWPKSRALLKPAAEHWILCRAPGPLRELGIEVCRTAPGESRPVLKRGSSRNVYGFTGDGGAVVGTTTLGRWPANVTLEHHSECVGRACVPECPARRLDSQSGFLRGTGSKNNSVRAGLGYGGAGGSALPLELLRNDGGGASRFFFCAKAKGSERKGNAHPTAKPVELMRWLVRLVSAGGGAVLDPFAGSGTTGVAALAEGLRFVGIEREAEHVETARRRLGEATQQTTLPLAGGAA